MDAIGAWLEREALPGRRVVASTVLAGGHANDNRLLTVDTGERYVLRRYLRANRCAFEAALAARLRGAVPVPEVVAADADGTAAGEPVLLSRFVDGVPLTSALTEFTGRSVGATLAAIGTADGGPNLASYEPTGLAAYVERTLDGSPALTPAEQARLVALALAYEPLLAMVAGTRRLVHSDFNPKNILVRDGVVSAVLDWEFAFSGAPLFDVGNTLRFADRYPPEFVAGFVAGFRDGGGDLPPRWREISAGLDLFALVEFLARPDSAYYVKAQALVRNRLVSTMDHLQ